MGKAFTRQLDGFRAYGSYCANHTTALTVLAGTEQTKTLLQEFLAARNPSGELSFAVQSYLIKPIQRILKYPLLLRELWFGLCFFFFFLRASEQAKITFFIFNKLKSDGWRRPLNAPRNGVDCYDHCRLAS